MMQLVVNLRAFGCLRLLIACQVADDLVLFDFVCFAARSMEDVANAAIDASRNVFPKMMGSLKYAKWDALVIQRETSSYLTKEDHTISQPKSECQYRCGKSRQSRSEITCLSLGDGSFTGE